ncbi:ribbon-helix-helix protein, CopG family [Saccharolobus caldissimus]|uniref:CopG family transcriptional regulator n=1 Tax=Saccharolobus caldissimus TaxID=1702097 RepID=A0AAQ4CNP7_9CREN|nr:ribbon-helix-helix protein, CopG family [Saccharolobus caldissimus]BDB97428.1 CopG family transcriptional regulator [Saccharolobus caldissimus]
MTLRVVTFKVDEELLTKLDLYAINKRLSRSEVIREAIEYYLSCKKFGRVYRLNSIEENLQDKTVVQEL